MASIGATGGLGSGLDVSGLVDKLMTAESKPLTDLQKKDAAVQVKISAFGTFKGAVSGLQSSLYGLEQSSAYGATTAKVADETVATATSSAGADVGNHSLEVSNLAAAQRLKTNAFKSAADTVGSGTLTLQFGSYDAGTNTFSANAERSTKTIKIDPAHNTLSGVRDAINTANAGVTASIVNDGTGNRLVLSSNSTGTANSVRIDVADDDGNATDATGLSQLAYDPTATASAGKNLSEVVAAQDAKFKLDGLDIVKSSNTVTDVLAGTTLSLKKTNVGSPTSVGTARDSAPVKSAIDAFVKAYNELDSTVDKLTGYDPATKKGGDLSGDNTVRSLAQQIRSSLTSVVGSVSGGYSALSQVGITLDRTGQLQVDATKLQKALDTDPVAVQGLFATTGYSKDSLVKYKGSTESTRAGNYDVNLSQLATQGQIVGSSAAALTIDSSNDTLSVTVNGKAATITLAHATYDSPTALTADVQSKLNGTKELSDAGVSVSLTESNGVLSLKSNSYGSESKITLTGGTAQTALFGGAPNITDGVDIAGSLGGSVARGSGQTLTAANGLGISVLGGATGDRGSVTFTRGIAVQLDNLLAKATGSKGILSSRLDSFTSQSKDIQAQEEKVSAQLEVKKARYTAQFNTLDGLLSNMQSQMSYLTQQLSSLNNS